MAAYEARCAMSGCAVVDIPEAAPIHPYLGRETSTVSNALLPRANIHTLFGPNLVGVDTSTMQICVATNLAGSCYWY